MRYETATQRLCIHERWKCNIGVPTTYRKVIPVTWPFSWWCLKHAVLQYETRTETLCYYQRQKCKITKYMHTSGSSFKGSMYCEFRFINSFSVLDFFVSRTDCTRRPCWDQTRRSSRWTRTKGWARSSVQTGCILATCGSTRILCYVSAVSKSLKRL